MKILYVATVLSHICQFHLPYLQMLQEQGHEVHVAAHDNLEEKNGLQLQYADRHIEIPFERSPYHPKNLAAYRRLKEHLKRERYDVIVENVLDPMILSLAGSDDADVSAMDLAGCAERYLLDGGMSREQIDLLRERLTGQ